MTNLNLINSLYNQNKPKWQPDMLFWILFALLVIMGVLLIGSMVNKAGAEDCIKCNCDSMYPDKCLCYDSCRKIQEPVFTQVTEPDWNTLIPIIIQIESSGNPNAISQDGCIGLMQISPIVLKEYNDFNYHYESYKHPYPQMKVNFRYDETYLTWSDLNIEIGTWYLKRIWNHYLPHYKLEQTIENLLIAYNFGIKNLVKYRQGKIKLPKETRNYLERYKGLARK